MQKKKSYGQAQFYKTQYCVGTFKTTRVFTVQTTIHFCSKIPSDAFLTASWSLLAAHLESAHTRINQKDYVVFAILFYADHDGDRRLYKITTEPRYSPSVRHTLSLFPFQYTSLRTSQLQIRSPFSCSKPKETRRNTTSRFAVQLCFEIRFVQFIVLVDILAYVTIFSSP